VGKQQNKEILCTLNLDPTKPLFSFIGRLLEEKGGDLLPHATALSMSENYQEINILILGSKTRKLKMIKQFIARL
jgi:starch synthase